VGATQAVGTHPDKQTVILLASHLCWTLTRLTPRAILKPESSPWQTNYPEPPWGPSFEGLPKGFNFSRVSPRAFGSRGAHTVLAVVKTRQEPAHACSQSNGYSDLFS
jgi:hypothetical protein